VGGHCDCENVAGAGRRRGGGPGGRVQAQLSDWVYSNVFIRTLQHIEYILTHPHLLWLWCETVSDQHVCKLLISPGTVEVPAHVNGELPAELKWLILVTPRIDKVSVDLCEMIRSSNRAGLEGAMFTLNIVGNVLHLCLYLRSSQILLVRPHQWWSRASMSWSRHGHWCRRPTRRRVSPP
jgi:hypothetical protein